MVGFTAIKKYDEFTLIEEVTTGQTIFKIDNSFYKVSEEEKEKYTRNKIVKDEYIIKDNFLFSIIPTILILATVVLYFYNVDYKIVDKGIWLATIFLIINIPIHELGHIVMAKLLCKEANIRAGMTIAFINPAFYVDTSCSYVCPKHRRISIYLAGNMFNALFVIMVMVGAKQYLKYCYLIILNIIVNFLPIVRSDGYNIYLALFNKYRLAKNKRDLFMEDFLRGICMTGLLFAVSCYL